MTAAEKYACIQSFRRQYPISMMCRLLLVSTSGFYQWCSRLPSQRALEDKALVVLIAQLFEAFDGIYGVRRIWKELRQRGLSCGRDRIARLMRQESLVAKSTWRKKRTPRTTNSEHGEPIWPNLLRNASGRDFSTTRRDEAWLADITYLATKEGWLYLSVVMDLHSRKIVGWTVRESLSKEGALEALELAVANRAPSSGLIHHSDRGVQYASGAYQALLATHEIRCSMSGVGDCWDNAPMESFFGRMKQELGISLFESRAAARQAVFKHIECFYNPRRRHSALGYLSPNDFEQLAAA